MRLLSHISIALISAVSVLADKTSLRGSSQATTVTGGGSPSHTLVRSTPTSVKGRMLTSPLAPKSAPMTEAECLEVDTVLQSGGDKVSSYRELWELICDDPQSRAMVAELKNGCLYVPTNAHTQAFVRAVGRFDTDYYTQVIGNQFFSGKCPTETPDNDFTSEGGHSVRTCSAGKTGFVSVNGTCISIASLGRTSPGISI